MTEITEKWTKLVNEFLESGKSQRTSCAEIEIGGEAE